LDLAFKEVGGFGFAQTLALLSFSILRNSGAYLFYNFPYLTLKQEYLCRTNPDHHYLPCVAET